MMRTLALSLVYVVCWCAQVGVRADELPPAMAALCDRAAHAAYAPIAAPHPAADALLAAIAASDDEARLQRAMAGQDLAALRGTTGIPALAFAAARGNANAVRLLLEQGAEIDQLSRAGQSALVYALSNGQPGTACLLIGRQARLPDPQRDAYLLPAVALAEDREGARVLVEYLAGHGYSVDATMLGDTALHIAAELGDQPLARSLLRLNARTDLRNQRQQTAQTVAERAGHAELARLLQPSSTR